MNPALLTAIISGLVAVGSFVAAIIAYGRSSRMAESQAISVTVDAAEGVVNLVTTQLERSMKDYQRLTERVDNLEQALDKERGHNVSLQLQLGKVRKRVRVLEEFIHEKGWEPPPSAEEIE